MAGGWQAESVGRKRVDAPVYGSSLHE
jgi:hypothetical protein